MVLIEVNNSRATSVVFGTAFKFKPLGSCFYQAQGKTNSGDQRWQAQPVGGSSAVVQVGRSAPVPAQAGIFPQAKVPTSTLKPGTAQGGIFSANPSQNIKVHPTSAQAGIFGQPSAHSGPLKPGTAQAGIFSSSGAPAQSITVHPTSAQTGIFGQPSAHSGPLKPGTAQAGIFSSSGAPAQSITVHPTSAQAGIFGQPSVQSGPLKPGTAQAGIFSSSGAPAQSITVHPTSAQAGIFAPAAAQTSTLRPGTAQAGIFSPHTTQSLTKQSSPAGIFSPSTVQVGNLKPVASQAGSVITVNPGQTITINPSTGQAGGVINFNTAQNIAVKPTTTQAGIFSPSTSQNIAVHPTTSQGGIFPPATASSSTFKPPSAQAGIFSPTTAPNITINPTTAQAGIFSPTPAQTTTLKSLTDQPKVSNPAYGQTITPGPTSPQVVTSFSPDVITTGQQPVSRTPADQDSTMMTSFNFNQIAKITDELYLSPAAAVTANSLQRHGITTVINLTVDIPFPKGAKNVETIRITVDDVPQTNLGAYFDRLADKIRQVRDRGGRTLVHCVAGVSRSASICIAYLMKHYRMTLVDAYRYVKARRPVIRPNPGFFHQLIEYERQLFGKTTVRMVDSAVGAIPDVYKDETRGMVYMNHGSAANSRKHFGF